MAPDSPVRKVGWPGTRPREPPARSIGDGPAERVPVFDPPDDDKARDKHVEPKRGVLSDAGSIPAASTHFVQRYRLVVRGPCSAPASELSGLSGEGVGPRPAPWSTRGPRLFKFGSGRHL